MANEQEQGAQPSIAIKVTHIRNGEVLDVFETPADEINFQMKEGDGNGGL